MSIEVNLRIPIIAIIIIAIVAVAGIVLYLVMNEFALFWIAKTSKNQIEHEIKLANKIIPQMIKIAINEQYTNKYNTNNINKIINKTIEETTKMLINNTLPIG